MNQQQLLEVMKALRIEILEILHSNNLANDKTAQKMLISIDNTFKRINQSVEEVIPPEILKSYFKGVDEATKALKKSGVSVELVASLTSSGQVKKAFQTQAHLEAIAEITDNTMLDLKAAIRTARRNTSTSIENALSVTKKDLQSGLVRGNPRKIFTSRVAESFASEGLTSFITIDGKRLPLDFYSQVVTRTNIKSANIKGAAERYRENGVELFTVSGNTPTCEQCYVYRGFVFSMVEGNKDFPYLDPATIPVHPHCQCSIQPYVLEYKDQDEIDEARRHAENFDPTKDTRSKAQKQAYEEKQRLNRLNNYEKKRYADIKGVLGDDAPANLGAFKRMKRANTDNYNALIQDYQGALRKMRGAD
ncbi:hypothetical protein GMD78_12255 [Ornithinibacillus sp. L9]|uniref:Minor capsid protein n=1 Tax=Ornithinibacillus caprae TaxID=2678566 RepID=A0A6N8FKA9_9BACI|nr:phage minor capsid protein [Ornithinibacillus caprae]MUK89146.1 hypothetical protein [Ornithinibacillus caprae]